MQSSLEHIPQQIWLLYEFQRNLGGVSASRFTIRMLVCELTEASMNLFVSITVMHLGLSNFSETCY